MSDEWKIVPVEPTDHMKFEANRAWTNCPNVLSDKCIPHILSAAISSAPPVPEELLERVARALGQTDIRGADDPCHLRSWIAGLFTDDYPTAYERERALYLADVALERAARAAIDAIEGR